jgi:hypothetical protein
MKDGQPLRSDDAPLSASGVGDNDFLFLMRGVRAWAGFDGSASHYPYPSHSSSL